MQIAEKETERALATAYRATKVTLMKGAEENAKSTMTVLLLCHVLDSNVLTHVQELVVLVLFAQLSIMCQLVHAYKAILEIHSSVAGPFLSLVSFSLFLSFIFNF